MMALVENHAPILIILLPLLAAPLAMLFGHKGVAFLLSLAASFGSFLLSVYLLLLVRDHNWNPTKSHSSKTSWGETWKGSTSPFSDDVNIPICYGVDVNRKAHRFNPHDSNLTASIASGLFPQAGPSHGSVQKPNDPLTDPAKKRQTSHSFAMIHLWCTSVP